MIAGAALRSQTTEGDACHRAALLRGAFSMHDHTTPSVRTTTGATVISLQKYCEERVASGPRAGKRCRFTHNFYSPSRRSNMCGQHSQSVHDAKPGVGPSQYDAILHEGPAKPVSLRQINADRHDAIDRAGRLTATVLRVGDVWRAFSIPQTFAEGPINPPDGDTPIAAAVAIGLFVESAAQ